MHPQIHARKKSVFDEIRVGMKLFFFPSTTPFFFVLGGVYVCILEHSLLLFLFGGLDWIGLDTRRVRVKRRDGSHHEEDPHTSLPL